MEKISNILNEFSSNPIFQILSLLIGLLGVFLAIIFFVKSKKKRKPYFAKRSFNIISDKIKKIDKINITYDDKPVDNLTVTKIAFWNGGNETINSSDLAKNDKLKIVPNEGVFLYDAKIIFVSNNTCLPSIAQVENEIIIDFDYFDFQQGFILQLTHSGKSSEDIVINGTVKGSGKIKHKEESFGDLLFIKMLSALVPFSNRYRTRSFRILLGWTTFILGIVLIITGFLVDFSEKSFIYALGITYGFLGFMVLLIRNSIPKGFHEMFEK